ncbi:MAG: NAD(P)-dependent glycerol-3-phosphate dehydrogenase, partial [Actinobacteria bacterium]|nr:NAD(P)-dependent glycerol-3-phosphate dehydrogenase [Actinomycetota bacterium]
RLWGHDSAHLAALERDRCNRRHLPEAPFPDILTLAPELTSALCEVHDIVLAMPFLGLRSLAQMLAALRPRTLRVTLACKGIEAGTHKLGHEVLAEILGDDVPTAVISGPSFAREVVAGLPTAVTVASSDAGFATDLVSRLHQGTFRAYTSTDVIGVELGGAVKNVLAIAAGVSDGLGFGANARAALISRGLAEMLRLGLALGGLRETFMGLAGLGDLVLSCTDDQSRNRRLGLMLGRGTPLPEALMAIGQVVEGVYTAREVLALAAVHRIDMPISEQVVRLLDGASGPSEAVETLLAREPRQESE